MLEVFVYVFILGKYVFVVIPHLVFEVVIEALAFLIVKVFEHLFVGVIDYVVHLVLKWWQPR